MGGLLQIHAKELEKIREFYMVNDGQRVKLEHAGNGIGILELGEPGI
jgi:hypothetical protein